MTNARLVALAALLASARTASAQSHHHEAPTPPACECTVCVAVPSTKKSTSYEVMTKGVTKCYVKVRSDLFRCLHHEPPAAPTAVPSRRRVLMKRQVTKEAPTMKYEAKTFPAPCPTHNREHCHACHGG